MEERDHHDDSGEDFCQLSTSQTIESPRLRRPPTGFGKLPGVMPKLSSMDRILLPASDAAPLPKCA